MENPEIFSSVHTTVRGLPTMDELDQYGLKQYLKAISGGAAAAAGASGQGIPGNTRSFWNRLTAGAK
jgi:hypothetical protein